MLVGFTACSYGNDDDDSNPTGNTNNPPEINDLTISQPMADFGDTLTLSSEANDPDFDTLTYTLYFGTTEEPEIVESGLTEAQFNQTGPNKETVYFWKIVADDSHCGTTHRPVWSFTTINAEN